MLINGLALNWLIMVEIIEAGTILWKKFFQKIFDKIQIILYFYTQKRAWKTSSFKNNWEFYLTTIAPTRQASITSFTHASLSATESSLTFTTSSTLPYHILVHMCHKRYNRHILLLSFLSPIVISITSYHGGHWLEPSEFADRMNVSKFRIARKLSGFEP